MFNKTGNVRINVKVWRVRVNIFAVEKQYVLHILSVSVVADVCFSFSRRNLVKEFIKLSPKELVPTL